MILYFAALLVLLSNLCSGQYVNEIDACIKNGKLITPEYNITEQDLSNGTCAFLLQSSGFIILQPIAMNISRYSRIRLYLITGNNDALFKVKVFEYYNQFLFKDFVYTGYGYYRYALVVLTKNETNSVGTFQFLYKTNCQVDLYAEDFPYFMSPNYMPKNPQLTSIMRYYYDYSYIQCVYTVSSRKNNPFTIKITDLSYYWYSLWIDNQYVNGLTKITFRGDQKITINFSFWYYWYYYWYYYNNIAGFTGSVELAYAVSLLPVDNVPFRGIPQISFMGTNYSVQYNSLSKLDAQVMCLTVGASGVKSQKPSMNYTNQKLISTSYQCYGSERILLQCMDLDVQNLYYKVYYNAPTYSTQLTCTERFRMRFTNNDSQSSGVVQIKYGGIWSYICADNMDSSAADVICNEMGYKSALYTDRYVGNREANNYYNYPEGDYYKYRYGASMNNIRCNSETRLKDCYYQTSDSYWNYWNYYNYYYYYYYWWGYNNPSTNQYSYYYKGNYYNFYRPNMDYYKNINTNYFYCYAGSLQLKCQDKLQFTLKPGHFQGYMLYNDSMICMDSFSQNNAEVYCRYLGYPGVRKFYSNSSINTSNYTLLNLQCNGNENSPADCRVFTYSYCTSGQALGVICQTVALAGTNRSNEGRIEVYNAGQKGLMCDDSFNSYIANIVCRQLGFSFALNQTTAAGNVYGFGNKNYLLDYLYCYGNEDSIDDCPWKYWRLRSCYGNDVAGVYCAGNASCGEVYTEERNQLSTFGYNTTFGANPWQVRIIPRVANEWCSGTIINKNWVLTSANCFTMSYDNFYITTSSSTYYWDSSNWAYTNNINSVFIHPQYSAVTGDYNLALVKTTSLQFDINVQPACLPSKNIVPNSLDCKTTGWNHKPVTNSRPLLGKSVNLHNTTNCQSLTQFDNDKLARYFCSDNNMDSSAIFNGESGGPLICSIDGSNVIAGVVSKSISSARATSIRLFTRVDFMLPWIKTTLTNNS